MFKYREWMHIRCLLHGILHCHISWYIKWVSHKAYFACNLTMASPWLISNQNKTLGHHRIWNTMELATRFAATVSRHPDGPMNERAIGWQMEGNKLGQFIWKPACQKLWRKWYPALIKFIFIGEMRLGWPMKIVIFTINTSYFSLN